MLSGEAEGNNYWPTKETRNTIITCHALLFVRLSLAASSVKPATHRTCKLVHRDQRTGLPKRLNGLSHDQQLTISHAACIIEAPLEPRLPTA